MKINWYSDEIKTSLLDVDLDQLKKEEMKAPAAVAVKAGNVEMTA